MKITKVKTKIGEFGPPVSTEISAVVEQIRSEKTKAAAIRIASIALRSRLMMQVQEELIVETPQDESMYVAMLLQEEMENAVTLDVPLTADAAVGKTWYDAKG